MEGTDFSGFNMDFNNVNFAAGDFQKPLEGNTDNAFFFGDEGIDTTTNSFSSQSFDSMNAALFSVPATEPGFAMQQNLAMDNTLGSAAAWNSQLDFASTQSFGSAYQQPFNTGSKRPLQLETQDFPRSKRHESVSNFTSPFLPSASVTGSSWTANTPSSSVDMGLSDEAADVCATWFSKYAVLPSDRHIESLSQLTGEPAPAIRSWFGQLLKQGMTGHDSAYKSQTGLNQQDQFFSDATSQGQTGTLNPTCSHETTQSTSPPALRGGKKGCTPTNNPELLRRDPEKIYQCTRKCGKRYGRKCDWKRNEEEGYPSKSWICSLCVNQGVEKVKPCFRKYHFSQHFRNIHPGLNCADYEETSLVQSDTSFPRRCGFCSHRFKSRQDRIDHIADHFKKGKSMLEWNEDGDDNNDSDDMDDDDNNDDKPSGDGFFGGNNGSFGGPSAPQGPPGPKHNGDSNNDNNGPDFGSFGDYGAFQQFTELHSNDTGGQSSSLPLCANKISAHKQGEEGVGGNLEPPERQQRPTERPTEQPNERPIEQPNERPNERPTERSVSIERQLQQSPSDPGEWCSSIIQYLLSVLSPEHGNAKGVDKSAMARDVVPRALISASDQMKMSSMGLEDVGKLWSMVLPHELAADLHNLDVNHQLAPEETHQSEHGPGTSILRRLFRTHESRVPGLDENSQAGVLAGSDDSAQKNLSIEKPSPKVDLLDHHFGRSVPNATNNKEWNKQTILNIVAALQKIADQGTGLQDNLAFARRNPPASRTMTSIGTTLTHDQKGLRLDVEKRETVSENSAVYSKDNDTIALIDACHPSQSHALVRTRCASTCLQTHKIQTLPPPRVPNLLDADIPECIEQLLQTTTIDNVQSLGLQAQDPTSVAAQWREVNLPSDVFNLKSQSFLSIKLLGTGGFSTVDEVLHRETQLRISRKTLKNREQSAMQELKKEVDVLRKLRHPHIIRFIGAYTKDDKVSILLSPVAETTLAIWLQTCYSEKPVGLADTVLKMFGCLASSIRYLHEQRPVVKHMDIKPQNILVMHGNTEVPHVVLCDFGISSSEDLAQDQDPKPLTRQYCAPEVPAGLPREQAADIWSLGCVFLEMMAAALTQDNIQWLDFGKEFSGREGKYYWQEVPRLQDWLSTLANQTPGLKEENALWAIKSMLNGEPTERPSAAKLTMVFTPASCCLSWPNEGVSFPGPAEELESVEMLVREDGEDCLAEVHVCNRVDHKKEHEPFARARTWLEECSQDHEACRRPESEAKMLPTRLLDIESDDGSSVRVIDSTCLMSNPTKVDYLAINYVWSNTDFALSTGNLDDMQTKILKEQLPVTINDAFTAAARMGFRYVWVDSLCVVQDSIEDKQRECTKMASVYRNAAMTIALDDIIDALSHVPAKPNTFANAQHVASKLSPEAFDKTKFKDLSIDWSAPGFAWDTRAWALQERLLCGRILHLTSKQMYWECNSLKASETFPRGLPSLVWEKVHTKSTASAIDRAAVAQTCPILGMRVLKNQQFLRKQGDGYGDAMMASTKLALKAHSADARRRNCRSPPSRSHSLKHDVHLLPLPMAPSSNVTPLRDVALSMKEARLSTDSNINFSKYLAREGQSGFTFICPVPPTHIDSESMVQVSNHDKGMKPDSAQNHSEITMEQTIEEQSEEMDIDTGLGSSQQMLFDGTTDMER